MFGSLTARLLDATAEDHGVLELSPFMRALEDRSLPCCALYSMLCGLHAMAETLEAAIRESDNALLQSLWSEDMVKSEALAADLATVRARVHEGAEAPSAALVAAITEYGQYIEYAASTQPLALAGYLFAHEGRMLEAPAMRAHVAAILGDCTIRLQYYSAYPDPMGRWRCFRHHLEAEVTTSPQQDVVVAGARDAFRLLQMFYAALSEDAARWEGAHEAAAAMGVVTRARRDTSTISRACDAG